MYRKSYSVDLIPENGGSDTAFVWLLARVKRVLHLGGGTCRTFCTGALVSGMERSLIDGYDSLQS